MKASLRPATHDDLPAISTVHAASARAAFGHIAPIDRFEPVDWGPAMEAADVALVAEDEGKVVGFIFTRGCEVRVFYTDPDVWGRGFGQALLQRAEDAMREAGCSHAFLFTEERNHRPLEIYARGGWHPDGEVKEREWLGAPIRELRLTKRLRE